LSFNAGASHGCLAKQVQMSLAFQTQTSHNLKN
jgi:hypothetical protein